MRLSILLFLASILVSTQCQSQSKNSFSFHYTLTKSALIRTTVLDGGGEYSNKSSYELGLRLNHKLSRKATLEMGLDFLKATVTITSSLPGNGSRQENLNLFTVPVLINYSFKPNYFLTSGILISLQNKENSFDKQSGIGFSFGLGRKFFTNSFYFFLNPKIDINTIIPFAKENYHQRLIELGLRMGVGYEF